MLLQDTGPRIVKRNLLDWNGRPASEDANPMYDFVNNLSEESRAELIKNYKESGKRIPQVMGLMTFLQGKNKYGMQGEPFKIGQLAVGQDSGVSGILRAELLLPGRKTERLAG